MLQHKDFKQVFTIRNDSVYYARCPSSSYAQRYQLLTPVLASAQNWVTEGDFALSEEHWGFSIMPKMVKSGQSLCSQLNTLASWSWKPPFRIIWPWNIDHVFTVKRQQLTLDFPLSSTLPCSDFRHEQIQALPKGGVSGCQYSEFFTSLSLFYFSPGEKKSWK